MNQEAEKRGRTEKRDYVRVDSPSPSKVKKTFLNEEKWMRKWRRISRVSLGMKIWVRQATISTIYKLDFQSSISNGVHSTKVYHAWRAQWNTCHDFIYNAENILRIVLWWQKCSLLLSKGPPSLGSSAWHQSQSLHGNNWAQLLSSNFKVGKSSFHSKTWETASKHPCSLYKRTLRNSSCKLQGRGNSEKIHCRCGENLDFQKGLSLSHSPTLSDLRTVVGFIEFDYNFRDPYSFAA